MAKIQIIALKTNNTLVNLLTTIKESIVDKKNK